FNQAQDIAFVIGKHLNVEIWKNYLVRVKYTRVQTRLKKEERQRNIKDAFLVREKGKGKGKTILLVDDVYTTGATLNEASKKIRQDGAEVFAFTLARTPEV
ncbi:MAG TPA: ComF family protein, partial [Candidatus Aerophobetes bacterium]|nr:ComF family protein [Candidatus Aerophobetes bacterium]